MVFVDGLAETRQAIAKEYENLSMQEKINTIAQVFGCTSGVIKTVPCRGSFRGTSDIFIIFNNNISFPIGNTLTPKAKTKTVQNELVTETLAVFNPKIVNITKETAAAVLAKREARDNVIAEVMGLEPYTFLNVELSTGKNGDDHLGWYYVTLAVDGKIHAHLTTGLSRDIKYGKLSETPAHQHYYTAGGLKEPDVDYVFHNVGFSTSSGYYTLSLPDGALKRAEQTLAQRKGAVVSLSGKIGQNRAAQDGVNVPGEKAEHSRETEL